MGKCNNPGCPICYPNGRQEEVAAGRKAEEDRRDCETCWRFYQKKAEAIVAVGDPIARNSRINAAYARLWIEDRRFQWAGLAAFASKQVGCGLLNAAEMIRKSDRERDMYQEWNKTASLLERFSPYASPRMRVPSQGGGEAGYKVFTMLARANTALFLEIWPLHMFYKAFGLKRFIQCLDERTRLRGSVSWPVSRDLFANQQDKIRLGFSAIDKDDVHNGVYHLAQHEQLNILQPVLYNEPVFATLMRANQLAWVLNIPTGSAQELQLTLANRCTVTGGNADKVTFSKHALANLADPTQRMAFVERAARRFDDLLRHPVHGKEVENSLFIIAEGGHR